MNRGAFQWVAMAGAVAGLAGVAWLLQTTLNPYVVRVVVNCGIGAILALSLNLVNGCAGQFSLGHAGFMAVGAYASAWLTTLSPLAPYLVGGLGSGGSILLGGLLAAVAGYIVGLPSLRLKGDYLAIVTLGFGEIIRIVFLNIPAVGGARGLPGIPRVSNVFWVYLWMGVTFLILLRLIRSSYGRAILSVREDEIAAQSMGVDIAHYKVVAFVVSSFFAGIAGGLFAHYQGFIDPATFNFNRSVEVVIMVVLGGMGSLSGSIVGGVLVTLLPELLRTFNDYRMVIFSLLLVVLMLVRPMGLFGHWEIWELPEAWRKKKDRLRQMGGRAPSALVPQES